MQAAKETKQNYGTTWSAATTLKLDISEASTPALACVNNPPIIKPFHDAMGDITKAMRRDPLFP
eukprot:7925239-Pyramimonas_sp.AAC.1